MNRGMLILILGAVLAAVSYGGFYFLRDVPEPGSGSELEWLRTEFHLTDEEFNRVRDLHFSYLPQCEEMCARIDQKNADLRRIMSNAKSITPEIEKQLREATQLRQECLRAMVDHFYQIAQVLPEKQRKRYLEWVLNNTIVRTHPDAGELYDHGGH